MKVYQYIRVQKRLAKTMNFYFLSGVDFKTVVGQLKEWYISVRLCRVCSKRI